MARSRRWDLALLAGVVLALVPTAAPPAQAAPPATRLAALQAQIASLYQQAEAATAAYDTATQAITQQQTQILALAREIVAEQAQVDQLTSVVGQIAAGEYDGEALAGNQTLQLLLAQDPQAYLAQLPLASQAMGSVASTLQQLQQARAALAAYGEQATADWEALAKDQATAAGAVAEIKARLAKAQALLASLSAPDLAVLQQLQAASAYARQMAWRASLTAAQLARQASGPAQAAIAYAVAQIGKPYLWGAVGPGSFDCSGLTMRAWQAAGIDIPRTSQEQWAQLRHVSVSDLRPGDLVVYFRDATHVALYVGDGAIIQAPHPGGVVELAAAGSMPILGVVRPD
ncbi:C40 family peptidase [Streptacidiphilus jiangxiensis]|uniref:Cell wall-associated hydrolase, NlpC family n=1 Tax=Streptacidiphilus jiangxiensis TaxID=235985 RepID=A0A1H7Y3T1_STRJI|nr:C40 family peptidase [Streptacidiphilus jiangxiensis]SEM39839.1 Cell wall-associated hydrolase, NlpC family [Streptacidiphilus jiangxiensis]